MTTRLRNGLLALIWGLTAGTAWVVCPCQVDANPPLVIIAPPYATPYAPPLAPARRPFFLGVDVASVPVNGDFIKRWKRFELGNPRDTITALHIQQIFPNSPASRVGLQAGDILLNANGVRLYSRRDLQAAIQASGGILYLEKLDYQTHTPMTITVYLAQ